MADPLEQYGTRGPDPLATYSEPAGMWGLARRLFGSAMTGDYLSRGGRRDIEDYTNMMAQSAARDVRELAAHPENLVGTGNLGIFAGPTARTANHALLRRAQEMLAAGRNRDEIWHETGWFQDGPRRSWWFEIDDSPARLTNAATAAAEYRGPRVPDEVLLGSRRDPETPPGLVFGGLSRPHFVGPLESGLHHPELYAALPELRRAEFRLGRGRDGAPPEGYYAYGRPGQWPGQISASAADDLTRRRTTLHELQHAIDEPAGIPSMPIGRDESRLMVERSDAIRAQLEAERPRSLWERVFGPRVPPGPSDAHIDDLTRRIERVGADEYHRQRPEVRARNVETRVLMSPEERRARPPWVTQDVPDEQQILRAYGGSVRAKCY